MNATQLLTYFDRISEAPDAIPRLRQFTLNHAVRGKLVQQDPNDEPASKLIDRIETQKARLIEAGIIKNQPTLPPVDPASMPFSIPDTWRWLQLRGIGVLSGGLTPSKSRSEFWGGEIDWFSPKDIKSDELLASELKITNAGVLKTGLQIYQTGCLFIVARSGILKRTFPVSINRVKATVNQDIKVLTPFVAGLERYLQVMLRGMTEYILSALVKTGTTVQSLKYDEFEFQPFPLPPIAEQRRIVARVDELMAQCDELEESQAERERLRDRLTSASLNRLNHPESADTITFREHARFHLRHLPRLTARPDQIPQLRQTILNLAVRGRLVRQDPRDEPIASVIERLRADCDDVRRPSRNGGRESRDGVNEQHSLPIGWSWLKGELVADFVDPQPSHRTPPEYPSGIPYIGYGDITSQTGINFTGARKVSPDVLIEQRQRYTLRKGDFVIGKIGTIGQPFTLPEPFDYTLSANLILIQPNTDLVLPSYLVTFFRSPIAERALRKQQTDSTHAVFGIKKAREFLIPVAPVQEQHRIVAKVEELNALCDDLESHLTSAKTQRGRLLEAVLHEALSIVDE